MKAALLLAALLPATAFAQHIPQPRETFAAEDVDDFSRSDRDWNDVVVQWRGVCDLGGSGDIVRHRVEFSAAASGATYRNRLTLRLPPGTGAVTLDGVPVTPVGGVVTLLDPFTEGFVGSPGGFVNTDGDWSAVGVPHVVQIDFPTPRPLGLGCPVPDFEVYRADLAQPIGDLTTYQGATEPMAARLDGYFRPPRERIAVSDAYVGSPSFTAWAADIADLSCDSTCGGPQWWEQPTLGAVDVRDPSAMEIGVPLPELPLCTDSVQNGDESGVDCGDPLGVCGACGPNSVPLFVGVSDDVLIVRDGSYTPAPWIFSLEGYDGVSTYAELNVKPTSGGPPILLGTDVLATSYVNGSAPRDRLAYAVAGATPGTMDVYVADAPSWVGVLLESGLAVGSSDGRRDLQFLAPDLLAIFSDTADYRGDRPAYDGTLDLAFTTAGGSWVTQHIDPGDYPPGHPDAGTEIKIGFYTLQYAGGTVAFLADYENVGCGGGVAGVAVRSADTWVVRPEIDGAYGTMSGGASKVCYSPWELSPDGTRLAYRVSGEAGSGTAKVAAAPSWTPAVITVPPPYDTAPGVFPVAFVDGGARLLVTTDSPAGVGVVSIADMNDVTMIGPAASFTLTPDNTSMVFVDTSWNFWVVSGSDAWVPNQLTSDGLGTSSTMVISDNGDTVAIVKDDATLYTASAPGWVPTLVGTGVTGDSSVLLDPGGRVVLYTTGVDPATGDGTCHVALSGQGWVSTTIDTCNLWRAPRPALSADGSAFGYARNVDPDTGVGDLWWASTVTGATVDVGTTLSRAVWASNNRVVTFLYPGTTDSYSVPLPTGPAVP